MENSLEVAKHIITALLEVNFYIFPSKGAGVLDSISKLLIVPSPFFKSPNRFDSFISISKDKTIYHFKDSFDISYCFVSLDEWYLFLGPYKTADKSRYDFASLMNVAKLSKSHIDDLIKHYKTLPKIEKSTVVHTIQALFKALYPKDEIPYQVDISIDLEEYNLAVDIERENKNPEYVQLTHNFEGQFMENISQGNSAAAKQLIRIISKRAAVNDSNSNNHLFQVQQGHAIARTLIRIAAKSQGVSSVALDSITSADRLASININSKEELDKILFQTIDNVCTLVLKYRSEEYSPIIKNTLEYILSNLKQSLSVKVIANVIGVSPNYLSGLFKSELDLTLTEFIRNRRLESAINLLNFTNMPIKIISSAVGIYDYNYFTKVFKKKYGVTPTEYRKNPKYL
ncbi:helix-turn-helix domain-containing protein [Alkalibacter saccharofermentans]|uniref:Helix-turn-helix domain-containing protein n=1 Tax=Alkalibacter saccharofermentans DSM 14828 TaxID=1120975 RepID=A0A1M4W3V0_9FIRM|nr:AraC family transcriptional regulator [Alkalibacter saccharofermentans]SHE75896.1 Helix-turn-helix domain-containing protein [Alkalibacter saccharofermentans DSM 14828]